MGRVIKFRAWDRVGARMLANVAPGTVTYFAVEGTADNSDCDLMQFSGLFDRNSKEIYEGDVVRWADGTLKRIVFKNGHFCFEWLGGGTHSFNGEDTEVVGNIHENPELLPA